MFNQKGYEQINSQNEDGFFKIVNAKSIQEVIEILIPDPPIDMDEYLRAGQFFMRQILSVQPNILDQNANPELAYKVVSNLIPPFELIVNHARVAVINMAAGNYRSGIGCILTMQETACQFGNNNILISASKLGFSILAFLTPNMNLADDLLRCSLMAQIPMEKKDEPVTYSHTFEILIFCTSLYKIISYLAEMNNGDPEHIQTEMSRTAIHLLLNITAETIDKNKQYKFSKFKVQDWAYQMVKQLGYHTI